VLYMLFAPGMRRGRRAAANGGVGEPPVSAGRTGPDGR
jgi:hypothetical protein